MKILGFEIKLPAFLRRDRRHGERARVFEDLFIDYRSQAPPRRGTGEGRDISTEGILFFSDDKLPPGMALELRLRISPGILQVQQIPVHARVLRCERGFREKQYRVACAFDPLDEPTCQQIQAYVAWLKQREQNYLFFRYNNKE